MSTITKEKNILAREIDSMVANTIGTMVNILLVITSTTGGKDHTADNINTMEDPFLPANS